MAQPVALRIRELRRAATKALVPAEPASPVQQDAVPAPLQLALVEAAPPPVPAAPPLPSIQSIKVSGIPLVGFPSFSGTLTVHLGSVVGTGPLEAPQLHVVRSITALADGSFDLEVNALWNRDAVEQNNPHDVSFGQDEQAEDDRLTKGLDRAKELFAHPDKSTVSLAQVSCLAVVWDAGNLRRLVTHAPAAEHVFWTRLELDADLDPILVDEADLVVYNRTRLTSQISCAPDLEV